MLFAAIDFFQYWKQKGRYSEQSLRNQGAVLATPADISTLGPLKPGYFFAVHKRFSVASWIIMYTTGFPWSHQGVIVSSDEMIESNPGVGIRRRPVNGLFDGR